MSQRPSPGRIAAMVLGGLLLAGLVCGGGGVFYAKQWADSALKDLAGQAEQTQLDARTYGTAHTQAECDAEGMRRGPDLCTDVQVSCIIDASVFLHTCLQAAPALAETCERVPSRDTPVDAGLWLAEECTRRGHPDRRACSQVLQNGLLRYCDEVR